MYRFATISFRILAISLLASLAAYSQALVGQRAGGDFTRLTFSVPAGPLVRVQNAPYYGRTTMSHAGMPTRAVEKQWRDSKGRVRTEPDPNPQNGAFVYIDDPVAGFSYVLDPGTHIAHRAALYIVPYSGPPGNGLDVGIADCGAPELKSLWTRDFSGVSAVGALVTTHCPVGAYQQNDKPVDFTRETWKSDTYNLTFISKNTGPGTGDNTRSIEDFNTAEPDASLFRVPSDYKVVNEEAVFTLATSSSSPAGSPEPSTSAPIQVRIYGPNFGGGIALQGQFLFTKDAPYSGIEANERDRTLADGTHLSQDSQTSKVWRDSAGRVRTEHLNQRGTTTAIEIADPAGYRYVLDPWNQIAYRVHVVAHQISGPGRPGNLPLNDADYPSTKTDPNGTTTVAEKLGTKTISGVAATGYRATTTGPHRTVTEELWEYAPYHLWLVDKQMGNGNVSTQKVDNFSPKEPDPVLFKIPDGYRVVDETGSFAITAPERAN